MARGVLSAVSWPWIPAWGSLEPPRRDGENAQKTGKNGEKMGEIRPKTCEGRELTKNQLEASPWKCLYANETLAHTKAPVFAIQQLSSVWDNQCVFNGQQMGNILQVSPP